MVEEKQNALDEAITEEAGLWRKLEAIHSVINICRFVFKFSYENMSKSGKLLRLRV
jgi:hypothetical protein